MILIKEPEIICTFIIKNILFFVLFIILKIFFLSSAIPFLITVTNSYLKQSTQKQDKFILTCDNKSFILQAAWHAAAFEPLLYLHNMAGNAEEEAVPGVKREGMRQGPSIVTEGPPTGPPTFSYKNLLLP